MEGTASPRAAGTTSSRDEAAIAAATGLFSFLLLTKLSLLFWHVAIQGTRPLADIPADGVLYLAGWDLLLCLGAALTFRAIHALEPTDIPAARAIGTVARGSICAAVIVFCVVSFQVARIYGEPLDVELVRQADSVVVMRESISAYLGPMPVVLLLYGFVGVPLLARAIARWLGRRRWLRSRGQLWGCAAVVCLGFAFMEKVRLARIYTFGVKDNAVLFFIKEYQPPFRPINAPRMIAKLETQLDPSRRTAGSPRSLVVPSGTLRRDFPAPAAVGRDFNVLVIQMESTGALHVDGKSAPNITALESAGLSFKRHVTTATQTRPASVGLYYSDYLPELGTTPSLVYGRPMPQPALAEVFQRAGYRTGVFHTGFLDYLELRFLYADKGFDVLIGAREMIDAGAPIAYSAGVREEQTVDELCRWIAQRKDEKFFATYLTEFPHHPYMSMADGPKPFPGDTWLDRYKNSLHYADAAVGRLIDFLEAQGLMEKTLIVVVGDHGETVSAYPVGHGLRVSAEEMRTPFVLHNPVLFPTAGESRLVSSHLDVAPTVARLVGIAPPQEWLGRDLTADEIPAVLHFVSITHIRRTCVVDNGVAYSKTRDGRSHEMFDFGERELRPLAATDPRQQLAAPYGEQAEWFAAWSAWRHLKRAHERAGGGEVAQQAKANSPVQ